MKTKVKDLTIIELQNLISETVRASMEEVLEDIIALSSKRISPFNQRSKKRLQRR